MRVLILSSHGKPTGCCLRGRYLARALEKAGVEAKMAPPLPCLPFLTDMALSLPLYAADALKSSWDVIMAMKPFPNACLPAWLGRARGALFVADVDDVDYAYRDGFLSNVVRTLQKPFPRNADLVTVHNDRLLEHVVHEFGVNEASIYRLDQGVDLDVFSPRNETPFPLENWYIERGIEKDAPILFYTAHLNVACDIQPILRIASSVLSASPPSNFLLAGGGPLERHCEELCRQMLPVGRWHMTGALSPEEVALHMQRATACLVYYEPKRANTYRTSMKLREYLAMGKPVAANDVGDLAEFGAFAHLASDEAGVAEAAVSLLRGEGLNKAAQGMAYVKKNLDWSAIGLRFKEKLEEMIHRKAQKRRSP